MRTETLRREDKARARHRQARVAHWDAVARKMDAWSGWGGYYRRRLREVYQQLVPAEQSLIEFGCAQGELLAALEPAIGVGVDFSAEMIRRASQRHPELHFLQADVHELGVRQEFDVIILSDLVNDLWDVQTVFEHAARLATPRTRVIINSYSRVWELPLSLAERLDVARPTLNQNWLTIEDIIGLLDLANLEVVKHWQEVLWPVETPLLANLCNRFLVKVWPFRHAALTNFVVARLQPQPQLKHNQPSVSVIIPARNEAGNIPSIFARTPTMGTWTELVFVEGHSTDGTYDAIDEAIAVHPERRCKLLRQAGSGKGDAVRLGFEDAEGDILMILDADLAVPPEDLPRFYEALRLHKGEFVNGVRLLYPMEQRAMRYVNLLGNKFFGLTFSWLLGQPVKDTLCGTKALWRVDYESIAANRTYFGDFDPFGDFDLLFGAAKLNLKIIDLPIRYRERTYGTTNIQRWRHGWLLSKMVLFGARRIKFS